MTIKKFTLATVILAALIVGLVDLSRRGSSPDPAGAVNDEAPAHSFIAETHRSDRVIDCPVVAPPDSPDPWSRELPLCWLKSGWSQPYHWGSLAMGPASVFEIDLDRTDRRILRIRMQPDLGLGETEQQTVTVYVNDQLLEERPVPPKRKMLRIPVPKKYLRIGTNSFSLVFRLGTSPQLEGTGKSHRRRSARISELTLTGKFGGGSPASKPDQVDVWDDSRQALMIEQAGTLALPIYIPSGAPHIDFDLRASIGAVSSDVVTTVELEELDGVSRHRSEIEFTTGKSYAPVRVPTESRNGKWALLTVTTNLTTGKIEVSKIRFAPGPRLDWKPESPDVTDTRVEPRPDIVLITLDAARADRFSFAGNPHETTPFIDTLAAESHVFPSAYSLVPYTLCSVPTMLTGLSFLDHGVTRHEDVLHSDAITLAEALHDAGYQTAAFTQTPNNSSSKGFDQGYEIFREMWTEGPKRETRRASFIARKVVGWLDSGARDERPLHLQVHIVPPHAPYDPPPEFDVFTDPDYDGSCVGFKRTLDGLDGGFLTADEACMDQMFGLYDGNLLSADHAVRTIIERLQAGPRWDNTVVLITSDHGEAFMEHGRMEHNSTLYTEMLHVPFVLRLPPGQQKTDVDTDRMVTVADIKPTLLSAAGLVPGHYTDGVDLLAPDPDSGSRFMVGRTATSPTLHGIRTLRWNLVVSASGSSALFDLEEDPGEQTNVRLKNRARFVGLGRILSTRLALPPSLEVAAETADITDDERELLEALGYVRD